MTKIPAHLTANPLVNPPKLPHGVPPLDIVKAEHFKPAVEFAIEQARAEIDAIKNNTVAPTFENTIEALEFAGGLLSRTMTIFHNLSSAQSSKELQEIEADLNVAVVQYGNDVNLDEGIFARVKQVYAQRDKLSLTAEQKVLLDETYKGFTRNGALLDDAQKPRFREVSEELTRLKTTYKNNLLSAVGSYRREITDPAELAGLPERVLNNLRENASKAGLPEGSYLILLSPAPTDIMLYAESRSLREEIYRAESSVCYKDAFDNSQLPLQIAKLRQESAQLLGYQSHADFVLDNRMARDTKTVMSFLKANEAAYRPSAEAHLKNLSDFAAKTDGLTEVKPWDVGYYNRRLQEQTYGFDAEAVRPYFDLERVLDGLRTHAEKLFDISMKEVKGTYPVYHPDVKTYEVTDNKTGEIIGLFYGDYYARKGEKRNGAWMTSFRERGIEDGENKFPIIVNVCNFAKPTPEQPTLLSLDDLRTVFHEFGHALHGLLAEGNYHSLTGTSVKWDFVELPSQLQENWAKHKDVLDTFARHFKTGELLPAELIQKINDSENFGAGFYGLRQTFQGLLDMAWHSGDATKIKSVEELEDKLLAESWLFPREAGARSTSFSHIFAGGYSAGYYSYKWAEVLEADIFELFVKKGLYDRETGDLLREKIYAPGGTRPPMDLFVEMMGREPDPKALFRREGLLPPENDNNAPENKAAKPPKI